MKLLIAGEIFTPDIGGPATYSQKIASELTVCGWQVDLICYSDKKNKDSFNFKVFRIIRSKIKGWHYIKYFFKLLHLARSCDLIYAQGPVSSGLPAILVGKIFRKKVVVKVVGDYAWEQARNLKATEAGIDEFQSLKLSGKIKNLKKIESFVCASANKVIVPSQYLKRIVMGWGVEEDKIKVVYNSFEQIKIVDKKNRNKDLVVSVGRLVPWKGFDVLINLMPELLEFNPNFILKIFGNGPDKNKLKELIDELNLKEKVFIDNITHEKLINELFAAGVFVLNTGYEGLSHTILEAMAAEVPIVTTNIGGNPELIENNKNGFLVEYNNKEELKKAILKIYSQPELAQSFIDASRIKLEKFTFENMINETILALQSV